MLGFEGENAREKVIVLLTMCFALAMAMLDNTVVNVALPRIQQDLNAGFSELQWVVDAYVLAFASLLLTGGILGDRYGRKKMFLGGLAVFTLFSFICGLAGTPQQLIVARALQGVGRRAADPRHAVDHHGDVPAARAREGARVVGRRVRDRAGARTDARRLHGGAPRVGVRVLPERPDRDHRLRRGDLHGAGVALRAGAQARHRRARARHVGAVPGHVRPDRSQRARLGQRRGSSRRWPGSRSCWRRSCGGSSAPSTR